MSWNHRILLKEYVNIITKNIEYILNIHEVYYDSEGIPNGYTKNPITISASDPDGLSWTVSKINNCLKKPILWGDDKFPQEVKVRYKCLLCGRDKFTRKTPHNCGKNFRKHKIEWEVIYE